MSFDLDAALGLPFTFTFDGAEYTLPSDVSMEATRALSDGEPEKAMRLLLGADQYAKLEASPKVFGARAFGAVLKAYTEYIGLPAPESSASPPSSPNIEAHARPISNDSTESTSPPPLPEAIAIV